MAVIRSALIAYADQDADVPDRRSVDDFVTLLREAFKAVRGAL
ncbi:hypothetical protein AB0L14_21155 [Streptomyces sp. NPDC052727]